MFAQGLNTPCHARVSDIRKASCRQQCGRYLFRTPGLGVRRTPIACASPREEWPAPSSYKIWPTEMSVSSTLYNTVQAAELVAYAALVDAGFSGDWSRIGVLTTDQELVAQQAWWFIVAAHSVVAVITVQYAAKQGYPTLQAGLKGFLFGSLGLYDVYVRCQNKQLQGRS